MEKPHKKLVVWQKAMEVVLEIYKTTSRLPSEEKFGLVSQMRRASVSVVSNLAEGAARHSHLEFLQFINISMGSCSELDTQLELCYRLGHLDESNWRRIDSLLQEVDRMLIGL